MGCSSVLFPVFVQKKRVVVCGEVRPQASTVGVVKGGLPAGNVLVRRHSYELADGVWKRRED